MAFKQIGLKFKEVDVIFFFSEVGDGSSFLYPVNAYKEVLQSSCFASTVVLKVNCVHIIKTEVSLCFMYSRVRLENVTHMSNCNPVLRNVGIFLYF